MVLLLNLDILSNAINDMENECIRREGALEALQNQKKQKEKALIELEDKKSQLELEFRLFKKTGEEARGYAAEFFCTIASSGANIVFGDNKTIRHKLYESGGMPYLDFEIVNTFDDGYEVVTSPTDASGGGVADIVAISAFSALSFLAKNGNSASWFFDEPNKYVSAGKDEQSAEFIQSLSKDFNRQIIMVSHRPASVTYSDKVYRVFLDNNGKSQVEDITDYSAIDAEEDLEKE